MQRLIDAARVTSPDWRQEMADFVKSAVSQRNDWSRSSRRMASAPCIYPRKRADQIGQIVFVRDTSGSVDGAVLNAFNSLIESAMADTSCSAILLDADASVRAEYRLGAGDAVPATAKGGGGTAFKPAFDRVASLIEAGEAIAGIVYLTDLEGEQVASSDIPTLWLCTNDNVAPCGRTVGVRL
jgi:predicted metal-dependent peptidase